MKKNCILFSFNFISILDVAVGFVGLTTSSLIRGKKTFSPSYSTLSPTRPFAFVNTTDTPFFNINEVADAPFHYSDESCISVVDPSTIEFVAHDDERHDNTKGQSFTFANMISGSARYIADHLDQVAVFYIPGELIEQKAQFSKLMGDIALSWMLGLKIVIVVGCRFEIDCCALGFSHRHECHNSLRVTNSALLKDIEQEAGHVRFEVERTLNKHLRLHGGMSPTDKNAPLISGNVVGGNFYNARAFGVVKGVDYKHSGFASKVNTGRIEQVLENSDIVLLSTVGTTEMGDLVSVNGNHLAASVAASLKARKLVFMATNGCVLREVGETTTMQDVARCTVDALLDYYKVVVNKAGFASFGEAKQKLDARAVELLLHLGWSSWAMVQGVNRAHIVNPGDGGLLEELFSETLGYNTCIYEPPVSDEECDLFNTSEFEDLFTTEPISRT